MKLARICIVILLIALVELSAARPYRLKVVKGARQFGGGLDAEIDNDYGNDLDDDDLDLDEYDDDQFDDDLGLDNDLDDDDAGVNNSFFDETLAPTGTTLTTETVPAVYFRRGAGVGRRTNSGNRFGGVRAYAYANAGGRTRQRRFKP